MSAATRRELKEIEASLEAAETEYQSVSDRLRLVQQERANTEEELRSQNSRLKAMLDEIATRKVREGAADAAGKSEEQAETRMTMAEQNAGNFKVGCDVSDSNVVTKVKQDTPAGRGGLMVGDQIIAIDGEKLDGRKVSEVLQRRALHKFVVLRSGNGNRKELL